jgi:hypothetical protein
MSVLMDLAEKRRRLAEASDLIEAAAKDVVGARNEGVTNAGYAAAWAAVLLATDIIKAGISAVDAQAAAAFSGLDKAIGAANRLLPLLRMAPIATMADVLKSVDPNVQGVAGFLIDLREAKALLARARISAPRDLGLVLTLATGMAEDTLLLLQAGQQQQAIASRSGAALAAMATRLRTIRVKLMELDVAMSGLMDLARPDRMAG